MAEIITNPCGCSVDWHKHHPLQSKINYCLKHAAADEMLRVLKSAGGYYQMLESATSVKHPVLEEIEAVIALATKESE